MEPIRWGILGASSGIAQGAVLPALKASPLSTIVGIGSRQGRAYQDVLDDPGVEAVYLPLPNGLHREWALRTAAAGKHLLCEKPLGMTASEAREIRAAFHAAGLSLMEGYMTPYHPRWIRLFELIESGRLGRLVSGSASFTFPFDQPEDHRLDRELGGGALLDVGVYCFAPFLRATKRAPWRVAATASLSDGGVDVAVQGWLDFGAAFAVAFDCSFAAPVREMIEFVGTEGAIRIDSQAFTGGADSQHLEFRNVEGITESIAVTGANPYRQMVDRFAHVVRSGAEMIHTPDDSVNVAELVDRCKKDAKASHD